MKPLQATLFNISFYFKAILKYKENTYMIRLYMSQKKLFIAKELDLDNYNDSIAFPVLEQHTTDLIFW